MILEVLDYKTTMHQKDKRKINKTTLFNAAKVQIN